MSKQDTQLRHYQHQPQMVFALRYLLHDIDSPANIGSFFRLADALGVELIHLTGRSIVPPNAKLRRLSRSAEKYVPFDYQDDALGVLSELKAQGYKVISLEITEKSRPLASLILPADAKVCLILGSENTGIAEPLLAASDAVYHIPMQGMNSSMNVASACAIASYQLTQQLSGMNRALKDKR